MAGDKITASQVARLAGVSQSAVSRVFTPGASVSAKTANKVREAAETLGYRPNALARSLITGKSRIIGLVVGYLDNQFYPDVLQRLSNALQAEGYHVLVFMASRSSGDINKVLEEIFDYQVDGLLLAAVSMSSELAQRCSVAGVPVVLFNRTQDDDHLSSVTSDNVAGGRKIAEHLLRCGCQKLAYIAGWEEASTQRDREQGYLDGLRSAGVNLHSREVGDFRYEQAQIAARRMFSKEDRPDAVFVCNDHMAFAVMDVLRGELGLKVPEQVAVVGYDDVAVAAWPAYSLTTVRQPANRMVEAAVETLMDQINDKEAIPCRASFDGPLIVRGSTRVNTA